MPGPQRLRADVADRSIPETTGSLLFAELSGMPEPDE
jgi:hypothetical protein